VKYFGVNDLENIKTEEDENDIDENR